MINCKDINGIVLSSDGLAGLGMISISAIFTALARLHHEDCSG